ncbi:hypothetical protein Q1W71_18795 [Flavobacterium pectinovorum]|uniref:hypothetical protein n=1 Tax=Flavobacterium pectinovorum TaxID=29533 RepID=UPI00265E3D29|nr:hypothetical protein [Flavobacterium pectinovorum]WKL47000.1 hypothetical protein Q1W71_18795 [Flavobacterium pectinovorum]
MKKIVLVFTILAFYSCNQSLEDKIVGKWNFENVDSQILDLSELRYKNSSLSNLLGSSFYEMNYLFFQKEKSYKGVLGVYNGIYTDGNWSFNENDSIVSFTENRITKPFLKIKSVSDKELRFSVVGKHPTMDNLMEFVFVKENQELNNSKFDYTQKQFNLWRKSPDEPEDLNQISKRVKQCLEYSVTYLKYNLEQKKSSVSLKEISFLPINFYDNGIQLKDPDELQKWDNVFFSNVDALNGREIIKQIIKTDFSLPEDKSGLELDIYILEEIKNRIK